MDLLLVVLSCCDSYFDYFVIVTGTTSGSTFMS